MTSLGFIKLPRVLRAIAVALLTDKQMHKHKSFRLGTEHALCRNRGERWWIWYKKTFRDFTTDIDESHSLSSRASLACDLLLAATSREIARKTCVHTWGLSPSFLGHSGRQIIGRRGEISGGCSFGRARTAATSIIFKALRRE